MTEIKTFAFVFTSSLEASSSVSSDFSSDGVTTLILSAENDLLRRDVPSQEKYNERDVLGMSKDVAHVGKPGLNGPCCFTFGRVKALTMCTLIR